jgi:hypothetical protein
MKGILFRPKVWDGKQKALDKYGVAVTRRVIKPQPTKNFCTKLENIWAFDKDGKSVDVDVEFRKHRYHTDEVVYVKEAWAVDKKYDNLRPSEIPEVGRVVNIVYKDQHPPFNKMGAGRWRSPLHLPKWAARNFLKIKSVRPERLQEITEKEAIKEGFLTLFDFIDTWDSINPDYPFSSNIWVWRIEFEKTERK